MTGVYVCKIATGLLNIYDPQLTIKKRKRENLSLCNDIAMVLIQLIIYFLSQK